MFQLLPIETVQQTKAKLDSLSFLPLPKPALTFGIELEFIVASLSENAVDPNEFDSPQVRELDGGVEKYSKAAFLNVQTHISNTLIAKGYDSVAALAIEKPDGELLTDIKYWIVVHDSSIQAPDQSYDWYSIELKSPPLYTTEESIKYIIDVVVIIKRKYRTSTNESCGIQVHVGDGIKGLELDVLRNLIAYIWTFEPQLMQIHPQHRLENLMCPTLWYYTLMGFSQRHADEPKTTRREGLEQLIAASSFEEILRLAGSLEKDTYYRTAYDFANLIPPFKEPLKRAIEFRQHAGTMDAERIERWLRLCIGLVRFARDTPREEVEEFCRQHVDKSVQDCPLSMVLSRLNLDDCGLFYQMRIAQDKIEPQRVEGEDPLDWEERLYPIPNWYSRE